MKNFLGIDLGTTFSAMATIDETGRPKIIHNAEGSNITRSCVAISNGEQVIVGEEAHRQWDVDPGSAAARFKRDMGTSSLHCVDKNSYTPTMLSSCVLKKLKQDAEKELGAIGATVVTIPANFANEAREATLSAAKQAGLDVKHIINEPTAAALYYAFKSGQELSGNYAVYDMGGGTFDISIIRVNGQDVEVLASNGIHKLGGADLDKKLQEIVQRKFEQTSGESLVDDDYTLAQAEEDKKSLSKRDSIRVRVVRQMIEVGRDEFEESISSLVTQAEMLCETTVDEAGIEIPDLRGVFLVGGSTRVPMIKASVKRVFGRVPEDTVNVDEVVALGASLYAAYKGDHNHLTSAQQQAIKKIKVSESTGKCFGTISIGIDHAREEAKLVNSILIRKGEKIPCSVTQSFYTAYDGQTGVNCQLTESTAPETDPRFVKKIWEGELELPPNRPEGQEIKVTFSYDDNQVMKCSFVDVETGRKTEVDMSFAEARNSGERQVDKFLVE